MRNFDLEKASKTLYKKEIIDYLTLIHEYKGKQQIYIESEPDVLVSLNEIAKIKSTISSNRIEGIHTTDQRIKEILSGKSEPKNRDEQEIKGYRFVLDEIHNNYEYIDIKSNIILQLHKDLYRMLPSSFGGKYKVTQNSIVEEDENGVQHERFKPLSPFDTPFAIEKLCNSYNECIKKRLVDPLIIIPIFIFDFLCIHPFNDGNGRMSRLLTLLLLYKADYLVGKYISIEMLIENNKLDYYESLQESSMNWEEGENDYSFFVEYYLGIILAAYREFESRTEYLKTKKKTIERIKNVFDGAIRNITKKEISEKCPDVSINMIEYYLNELQKDQYIEKIGGGRYTSYKLIAKK